MKKIFILTMLLFNIIFINNNAIAFSSTDNNSLNLTDSFSLKFYGELYTDIYYGYSNKQNNLPFLWWEGDSQGIASSSFFIDSNFGIKTKYNNISANFEIGFNDIFRKYFVQYDFQDKYQQSLIIGKDTNLTYYELGQVLNGKQGLNNYGTLADNKRLQIKYQNKYHKYVIALIFPFLGTNDLLDYSNDNGYFAVGTNIGFQGFAGIPRIEAAYYLDQIDKLHVKIFTGYGAYVYQDNNNNKNIIGHSAVLGMGGKYEFIKNAYLDFTAWGGINLYLSSMLTSDTYNPVIGYTRDQFNHVIYNEHFGIDNIYSVGGAFSFSYALNYKDYEIIPQIGIGINYSANKILNNISSGIFINTVFKINSFISIVPEISYEYDNGYSTILAGVNAKYSF